MTAIETANNDAAWKSIDHCGPTFIDAAVEGSDADPWRGPESALAIPAHFMERGAPALITFIMDGGVVQHVTIENQPAKVVVRDYDIEGADPAELNTDENGDRYVGTDWSNELPPAGG
jgi:hypothetical protein